MMATPRALVRLPGLLDELNDFPSLFDDFFAPSRRATTSERGWLNEAQMPMELRETTTEYKMTLLAPGIDRDSINIQATPRELSVEVTRHSKEESAPEGENQEDAVVHRREIYYGSVRRAVQFSEAIQPEAVDAAYENGVLTLTIPKQAQQQIHKISVKTV